MHKTITKRQRILTVIDKTFRDQYPNGMTNTAFRSLEDLKKLPSKVTGNKSRLKFAIAGGLNHYVKTGMVNTRKKLIIKIIGKVAH